MLANCKRYVKAIVTVTPKRRSSCPISFGLDVLGDKWTLLILRDMLLFGQQYFGEFARYEGIATNILTDRLQRLEGAGMITREPEGARVRYAPTNKGAALAPVLTELMLWGIRFDNQTPVVDAFRDRIAEERDSLSREINASINDGEFEAYRARNMGVGKLED